MGRRGFGRPSQSNFDESAAAARPPGISNNFEEPLGDFSESACPRDAHFRGVVPPRPAGHVQPPRVPHHRQHAPPRRRCLRPCRRHARPVVGSCGPARPNRQRPHDEESLHCRRPLAAVARWPPRGSGVAVVVSTPPCFPLAQPNSSRTSAARCSSGALASPVPEIEIWISFCREAAGKPGIGGTCAFLYSHSACVIVPTSPNLPPAAHVPLVPLRPAARFYRNLASAA